MAIHEVIESRSARALPPPTLRLLGTSAHDPSRTSLVALARVERRSKAAVGAWVGVSLTTLLGVTIAMVQLAN